MHEKDTITILGLVTAKKITATKSGSRMAFLTVEDEVGSIEAILFPKRFEMLNTLLETGKVAALTGELTFKDTDETGENGEPLREGKLLVSRAVPAAENGKLPLTGQETAVIHKEDTAQNGRFTVSFAKLGQDAFSKEPGKAPEKPRRAAPSKQEAAESRHALPPLKTPKAVCYASICGCRNKTVRSFCVFADYSKFSNTAQRRCFCTLRRKTRRSSCRAAFS